MTVVCIILPLIAFRVLATRMKDNLDYPNFVSKWILQMDDYVLAVGFRAIIEDAVREMCFRFVVKLTNLQFAVMDMCFGCWCILRRHDLDWNVEGVKNVGWEMHFMWWKVWTWTTFRFADCVGILASNRDRSDIVYQSGFVHPICQLLGRFSWHFYIHEGPARNAWGPSLE